jgi:DNA-binding MarR family transcriptional regulator
MNGHSEIKGEVARLARRLLILSGAEKVEFDTRIGIGAHHEYQARRRREAAFGADASVFGEPSWDILLDLYLNHCRGGPLISISSACIASAGPQTTALRHIGVLVDRGLLERVEDAGDRRRSFVRLTQKALAAMDAWVSLCE